MFRMSRSTFYVPGPLRGCSWMGQISVIDHEVWDKYNRQQVRLTRPSSSGTRPYTSVLRNPTPPQTCVHESYSLKNLSILCQIRFAAPTTVFNLFQERRFVHFVNVCTTKQCLNFAHMKLDVHQQVHCNAEGKRVVILERVDVCMAAWHYILGISESTFHWSKGYAARSERAQRHRNMKTQKTYKHMLQAVATLKCILEKIANHMPHCTHTLPSREKVVSKVLPATFL